jgi:hypothetical protein
MQENSDLIVDELEEVDVAESGEERRGEEW